MTQTVTTEQIYNLLLEHSKDLKDIKFEVKKTNGRVTSLEACVCDLKKKSIVHWIKDNRTMLFICITLLTLLLGGKIYAHFPQILNIIQKLLVLG